MEKSFGENLTRIRKQKGISQSGLAEQLHISRQAVSNWERGKSYPDLEMLAEIANALEVPASALLSEKRGDGLKISLWPLLFNIFAAAVHTVLAALGFVNFFAVTAVPWTCAIMMAIVALSFRAMFRSGSYDMLAGFNSQKDSVAATRKQMYWLHLLVGILSCLYQVIFAALYFAPAGEQMDSAVVLMCCYIGVFAGTAIAVSIKIKTR